MSEGAAKKGFREKPQPKEERRKFQAIRGVRDLLPPETALWNRVEQTAHEVFATYGYGEIRLPIFESTDLFARAVGGETDIVSKEMYSFRDDAAPRLIRLAYAITDWPDPTTNDVEFSIYQRYVSGFVEELQRAVMDGEAPSSSANKHALNTIKQLYGTLSQTSLKNTQSKLLAQDCTAAIVLAVRFAELGDYLSLRPEATASVCRAYIEHNMQQLPQPVKLYTMGPMFRRERPQKGRYRQFYQIDAEVLETIRPDATKDSAKELAKDAAIDAEVIEMLMTFFDKCGLRGTTLYINSIGHNAENCRRGYVEKLRAELTKIKGKLGDDSQRRIDTNPLRVLDSKLESEQPHIEKLPRIADHLCDECKTHYAALKRELDLRLPAVAGGVKYQENWRLVRGLDYYMRTTFEITAPGLGSQNAVCGGGRYDGVVELLGGPPTKGIGFAIGEDRLILSLQESGKGQAQQRLDVYVAWMGEEAYATAIRAAKNLRNAGFRVELPPVEQKFGRALGQADKLGAHYALILGDNEVQSGEWMLKTLANGTQQKMTEADLLQFLRTQKSA